MKAKLIKTIDEQGVMYSLSGDNLPENYVLSDKNCQAIERGYDLDDIIQNNTNEYITTNIRKFNYGFKKGFQKALEILGDKKFSEKDLKYFCTRFAHECRLNGAVTNNDSINVFDTIFKPNYLIQQTEWDVIVDNLLTERHGGVVYETPKLDSKGRLILKKI